MPTLLKRAPRNLGTLTSPDLDRSPTGVALNRTPMPTGAAPASTFNVMSARIPSGGPVAGAPAPLTPLARTPQPMATPDISNLQPGSFAMKDTLNNAGIYEPGSFGDQNAKANGTGYRAPQQTERANPMTGDNNIPMESTTTVVNRAPFGTRGNRLPVGQDARTPAAVRTTTAIDSDIEQGLDRNMGGSGLYRRSFTNPTSAGRYDEFVKRLFSSTSADQS